MTAPEVRRPPRDRHAATAPAPDEAIDVDIRVAGLVTLRLLGVRPGDRSAVERQYGTGRAIGSGPADVTIRYCDDVGGRDQVLRYLGPGASGFTEDGFVILRGRFRRPVRVVFPGADLGGPCELRCEHGVGRVPHLVALVNLAVLNRGGVALHASAFERDGTATMATGWSKGGKTEALLAACDSGATYVSDEWTHIRPDRTVSGTWEPVRAWDWQLEQLPWLRERLTRGERTRLAALRLAERTARTVRATPRITTAIARNRFVDVVPETVAGRPIPSRPVPLGQVLLMTATDRPLTWSRPLSSREVADRMAASLAFERGPLAEAVAAYRFAFPKASVDAFDAVPEIERERLRSLLAGIPAAEVLHPYPVDLHQLADTIALSREDHR
ncbi:hypothetical protein [Aquihabitans sp. McL0605]|uniref:hypothetical protein n=1 Tax=Aquihabitans sp. McL0605 TaxID=3415671 RepID=UPI003CEA7913